MLCGIDCVVGCVCVVCVVLGEWGCGVSGVVLVCCLFVIVWVFCYLY